MKAVAYARFSSDNQREESIDAQLRAIREYCERNGYDLVNEYTDEARSATSDKRPAFQQMIADSEKGEFDLVIVHKLDRFSRDRFDSAFYRRALKKNGVVIKSVLENLDGSPESIILESVLEGMAEYYSKNLAREVMKGMKETAYKCKHTGGVPPLGYALNPDKTYRIEESEAVIVRKIFQMYADGKGYSDIIAALENDRTRTGARFGKNSISDLLRNEKYRGIFIYNRTTPKTDGKRNNHASRDESEIIKIPGGMPRIISDETWTVVQERLHNNKRNASNRAKSVYLLSGKLLCGECHTAFVAKSSRGGRNKTLQQYYICGERDRRKTCDTPRVSKNKIEQIILDEIASMFQIDAAQAAAALEKRFESMGEPNEVKVARKELVKVQKSIAGLVEAAKSGMFHPTMKEEMDRLSAEELRLKNLLNYKREIPSRAELTDFLESIANIKEKTEDEQKRIINSVIEKIVIYKEHPPEIFWRVRLRMVEADRTARYALFSTFFDL